MRNAPGPDVSLPLRTIARRLSRRRGVVGVFFGRGSRQGIWELAPSVVVHVTRKVPDAQLPTAQRLPRRISGYPVDVIEVGIPHTHSLDVSDEVTAPGARVRSGTFTALRPEPRGGLALVSGHVSLPYRDALIATDYDSRDDPPSPISAVDGMTKQQFQGGLVRGAISPRADWAMVMFPDAAGASLDAVHPLIHKAPPLPLRSEPLVEGQPLRHFSRFSGAEVGGVFVHRALSPMSVRLDDGSLHAYQDLLVVARDGGPFSRSGDSGSLVCDADGRAVGIVLGGADAEEGPLSYLLPVDSLRAALAEQFNDFFQE